MPHAEPGILTRLAEAEQRWQQSERLVIISRELSQSLDRQTVIDIVCRAARELAEADGACVILREDEMVHYCREDAIAPLWAGQKFSINNCISGWSILHRAPVVIQDIFTDERIPIDYYRPTFVKSLAMMPIQPQNPIGAIGVYWARQHSASERQLELLTTLASAAAIAFVNVELYERINELLRREQEARREAEAANRAKDEFLMTLSHELRTPLNAIIGWAEILRKQQAGQGLPSQALDVIKRNAQQQAHIVEDILEVSAIITGKLQLAVQPIDLMAVIQSAVDSVRLAADAKEISFQYMLNSAVGPVVGDANRLQQVLWNLLSNALKFTPRGGLVTISLEAAGSDAQIRVSDNGEGLAADFLPHVFDRFRQSDSSYTRNHGGLGLGLAIVRHLVEMHGGSVAAASDGPGRGATFTLKLPMVAYSLQRQACEPQSPEAKEPIGDRPPTLTGLKVLAVEDEPDSRELLGVLLEMSGAIVRTAGGVSEALAVLSAWRPDVLITDIGMPGQDGYDLIRQVRARAPHEGGDIPAIALTGFAGDQEAGRALSAGFQAHLAKPIEPATLEAVIIRLVTQWSQVDHNHLA